MSFDIGKPLSVRVRRGLMVLLFAKEALNGIMILDEWCFYHDVAEVLLYSVAGFEANGEDFSMSDCAAAAAFFYAVNIMPYDDYPNVAAYAQRLSERDSVKKVRAEAEPHMQAFLKSIKERREKSA
jgi:hypothetical protein